MASETPAPTLAEQATEYAKSKGGHFYAKLDYERDWLAGARSRDAEVDGLRRQLEEKAELHDEHLVECFKQHDAWKARAEAAEAEVAALKNKMASMDDKYCKAIETLVAAANSAEAEVARLKAPLSEDEVKAMVRAYWAMRPNSDSTSQEAFNRMHYEAMRAALRRPDGPPRQRGREGMRKQYVATRHYRSSTSTRNDS